MRQTTAPEKVTIRTRDRTIKSVQVGKNGYCEAALFRLLLTENAHTKAFQACYGVSVNNIRPVLDGFQN